MKIADVEFNLDENYKKVKSLPDDPKDSVAFCSETEMANCIVLIYPFPTEHAMPFTNCQAVIDGIHGILDKNQGLIEVEKGTTKSGLQFIETIVKTFDEKHQGVSYCLTLQIKYPNTILQVQGFFNEAGTTGIRDSYVFAALEQKGTIKATDNGIEGWAKDPYDENFKSGLLKNLSEDKDFDQFFPAHPLSECRRILDYIIENN